jgi:hypothetical protein
MFVCTNPKFNYMKKVVLFIALVATTVAGAQAQKFQGGEKNLEVQFSPLSGNPIGINGLRFRMFNSESSAIRVGFSVGGSNVTDVRVDPYEVSGPSGPLSKSELYSTTKDFNFSIRPGYEIHFAGTDRLSPYIGAELLFQMNSSSYSEEYHGGNTDANDLDDQAANWSTWNIERKEGSSVFGLNAVGGVDFYFADNFYLGAEIGLGFQSTKYKNSELTISDEAAAFWYSNGSGATAEDQNGALTKSGAINSEFTDMFSANITEKKIEYISKVGDHGKFKDVSWGPNFQSTLRLGWLF